ncbi:WhiB family transcriptional regulator [Candidatus Saccharibacteria bacterium]|nr:WhiB family transcriptional regulator [Candidatus Saccharibacteria bacterium]
MKHAACRGLASQVFHPEDGVGVSAASEVCKQCPVREDCLDYAIALHIDHGVWGGTSERERRRIAKRRRQEARRAAAN